MMAEVCKHTIKQPSQQRAHFTNACTEEKRTFFWSFPYVCPEPVLVKCSFFYIDGSKRRRALYKRMHAHAIRRQLQESSGN
jgi:hypothetical protein